MTKVVYRRILGLVRMLPERTPGPSLRCASSVGQRRCFTSLLTGFALRLLGCSSAQPDPGAVRFLVRTTPVPDDAILSPLRDARVTALELRDARTDDLLARSRFDPPTVTETGASMMTATLPSLDLGSIKVSEARDLRMLALGAAGQQLLGVALTRDVAWQFGETKDVTLELRRPLFFFGGSPKLVAPFVPPDPIFAPSRRLYEPLRDESKLRVVDPNSVQPLLSIYDRWLDPFQLSPGVMSAPPVSAAAGTYDGQSLLVSNLAGKLHVVDTLRLDDQASFELQDFMANPVQGIVVDPLDRTAVILQYPRTAPAVGRAGLISFIRNLPGLRSRVSKDGDLLIVSIDSTAQSPVSQPLAAAYTPDGMLEVVFGKPPLSPGEPDCGLLGSGDVSVLRRYNPKTGEQQSQHSLPYTTSIAYTLTGEQVLVQPCASVSGANRVGRVVVARPGGDKILSAPGILAVSAIRSSIIGVGRDDNADAPTLAAQAKIFILESGADKWSSSAFDLPAWQVPYRITLSSDGKPYVSSIDISFAPTDVSGYSLAVTPDRARALSLLRVQHKVRGLFLTYLGSSNQYRCYVDWSGYSYHVALINLQSGAREQDYIVGFQNQDCTSRVYDSTNAYIGTCLPACDPSDAKPYLRGFQEGYVPSAASVLFGR